MGNEKARHNRILSEKKKEILKKNTELTSDSSDDLDIKQEVYKMHADEVESVLNEIGVGGTRNAASSDATVGESDDDNEQTDDYQYNDDVDDIDDIDDEDDYLEEDIFDIFSFAKKKKKRDAHKTKKHSEKSVRDKKNQEESRISSKKSDIEQQSEYTTSSDSADIPVSEDYTQEILNQEELAKLEEAIESGEYDDINEEDSPNAGIYESFGGYGADTDYDESEEADEEQETDSEKLFRERILDEKMPEPSTIPSNVKWLISFAVLLVAFIVITVCYFINLAKLKNREIDVNHIHSDDLLINDGVKEKVEGYKTIVLYGVDSREANLEQGTNSDTIIIVSINETTKEVKLVSVYRDTLLDIQSEGIETNKVNYAYQLGGAIDSINTLNANLDLYITDYVAVDFGALADIIDAVGGIEIDIADKEIDNLNKNLAEQIRLSGVFSEGVYEKGKQLLNGQQAVAYSRIRSTDAGDITRTERQRRVLLEIWDKLANADASMVSSLIDVSFECISTSITKDEALALAEDIGKYKVGASTGFPFSYSGINLNNKGNVLVAADLSGNVAALHEFLYGDAAYTPSNVVTGISDNIATETGVAAQKVTILTDEDNSDNEAKEDVNTLTDPPEGMLINE
ncbi:MAG: LCP family protein [Coprococcus sp.]